MQRVFFSRPRDGVSSGASRALRRRKNGVCYTRRPLREDQDAVLPVQCAVHLPATHVDRTSLTDDAHLSRVPRRRDRIHAQ